MQYLQLRKDVQFIHGAKNSALYDLEHGDVYAVEKKLAEAINFALQNSFNKTVREYPTQSKGLKELLNMGLAILKAIKQEDKVVPRQQKSSVLNFVWLELLESCNLRCIHCYGSFGKRKNKKTLELKDWKKCLQQARKLGCKAVQFIGGEPFMYPHLMKLVEYANELKYELIEIFTNATLITKRDIETLAKNNVSVAISIYSSGPNTHDAITKVLGSFTETMKAIKALKKAGIKTRFATVLMKQNQDEIQETIKFLAELGEVIPLKSCDVVRPVGRGGDNSNVPDKFMPWLYRANAIFPKIYKKDFLRNKNGHPCWQDRVCIKADGAVIPCIMARNNVIGNIFNDGLANIVNGATGNTLSNLSKDNINVCKDCEFRYACVDCRPHVESLVGDIKAKPPTCLYNPYTGVWSKPPLDRF